MITNIGTILIVDDDLLNRIVLSTYLEEEGHIIEMAEDGQQALKMLHAQPFDVVLLDLIMPEMDGYQVLEQMKADNLLRHIPVIVISALDEMDSVIQCIEMGAMDYLPKPFNPVLLRARLNASLAAKRLRDHEQAYLQAIKREMELGRKIQTDFLPRELPQPAGWEIAVSFRSALEVSGDFYDAFILPDGQVGLIIADICGKGVGAALFMALIRSLIRFFTEQVGADVFKVIPLTNNYIVRHHQYQKRMFATIIFGVLDTETGIMTYINAGHHPPIMIQSDGAKESSVPVNPGLGMFPDSEFSTQQLHFGAGDILLTYTDGITEAFSPTREFYSTERLMATLQQTAPTAAAMLQRIEASVEAHILDAPPSDDMTMLAIRRVSIEEVGQTASLSCAN